MSNETLYARLGGYDGIVAFVDDLLPRLKRDAKLGRFWLHRGNDGIERERQLLIDYLANKTGGSMYYAGRDMKLSHEGMGITEEDWLLFLQHAGDTIAHLHIADAESKEVVNFVLSLKENIVDQV